MREVDLSSDLLLSRHQGALDVLRSVSRTIPEPDWCVIGGMMTYLVLKEHLVEQQTRASQTKDVADIRVPPIGHAVVIKADAVLDPRTSNQPRHLEDVIELLSAIGKPAEWAGGMNEYDRNLLELVAPKVETAANLEATAALALLSQSP